MLVVIVVLARSLLVIGLLGVPLYRMRMDVGLRIILLRVIEGRVLLGRVCIGILVFILPSLIVHAGHHAAFSGLGVKPVAACRMQQTRVASCSCWVSSSAFGGRVEVHIVRDRAIRSVLGHGE